MTAETRKMMGGETELDRHVALPIRDWNAVKLALWRSKYGWDIITREALALIERCVHADGCPGRNVETEPCLPDVYAKPDPESTAVIVRSGCPDRELRMSALVMLNAARMFAPIDARRPADERYFAPSREYYSEVWAALASAQAELDALRAVRVYVEPPPNDPPAPLALSSAAQAAKTQLLPPPLEEEENAREDRPET